MNITLQVDECEVQEYDDFGDFSPVDSSSVWEVCAVDDVIKEEFDAANGSYAEDSPPWRGAALAATLTSAWPWNPPMAGKSSERSFRDILRKVMVSEETLQCAVARLGGGAQGLQVLMDHVNFWASSASHEHDVSTTIRKGIVGLSMPPLPKRHGVCLEPQWRHNAAHGTCEGINHGAAYSRALRKSHMVRQRGQSHRAHRPHALAGKCGHQSRHLRNSSNHQWMRDLDPQLLGNGNEKGYEFLFQKELRASDVSSLGRIVLPKKDAERHLPFLVVREGVMITLEDYHSGALWTARYRFWPNNKSRMYLLENIGAFVTFHCLQEGDLLLCYRNSQGGYVIRSQKVPSNVKAPARGPSSKGAQPKETTETAEMKNPINTAMPPIVQFTEGDESTTGTSDSSDLANSSCDSQLGCTLRAFNDGAKAFDAGYYSRQHSCVAQQMDYYMNYEEDALQTGFPASYKPLEMEGLSYDPVVAMLSVNVKQRYMDDLFLEPE